MQEPLPEPRTNIRGFVLSGPYIYRHNAAP